MRTYDALALFSGGLDSILAAKVVAAQGLDVLCLHFTSPFFGAPGRIRDWRKTYGLDITSVDVGDAFVRMLAQGPKHGLGRYLNPCVDCKIFMLRRAKAMLAEYGARFLVSGEVKGQRPMSQRLDALNIISRDAEVRDILVRPLCAGLLPPTQVEESGLLDREKLHAIGGRGRKEQLRLAREYDLTETPTPAGGCLLTEMESARRFFPVFRHMTSPCAEDFELSNIGRQYWNGPHWLAVGRNMSDNNRLEALIGGDDLVFKVRDFPGPLAVGRCRADAGWDEEAVLGAAAVVASYSPKARRSGGPVMVNVGGFAGSPVAPIPDRGSAGGWREPSWEDAAAEKAALFGLKTDETER